MSSRNNDVIRAPNTDCAPADTHGNDVINVLPTTTSKFADKSGEAKIAEQMEPLDTATCKEVNFDELMNIVGEIGCYQWIVFIFLSMGIMAECMVVFAYVFVAATPSHFCSTPELDDLNLTESMRWNLTLPRDDGGTVTYGQVTYSSCKMYDRNYGNWTIDDVTRILNSGSDNASVIECRSGWTYDQSIYASTIVTDWDLVCENRWMASFAYTAIGIGQFVGATFYGHVTDRYGRKRPYFVAVSLVVATAVGASFSPNYIIYCVLVFIMGANTVALFATAVTLAVELVGVSWRGHFGTAVNYFWTVGYMLLAGVAYGLRYWWMLQLVISSSTALLLTSVFFIPESPRWLYMKRRTEEADLIMEKLARYNGVDMPRNVKVYVSDDETASRGSFLDMFRTGSLRKTSAILCLNWFSNALIYYGISLFVPRLAGDEYLNFFLSGIVEIPGYLIAQLSIRYLGRRLPLCITMVVGGVALLVIMAIPDDIEWLSVTLSFIGKLCVTASWAIVICFTAELYPTVVRGIGMFTCTLCGNVGNAVAPFIGQLAQFSWYLPLVIFGSLSVVAGLTSLVLPETRDIHLEDTMTSSDKARSPAEPTADVSFIELSKSTTDSSFAADHMNEASNKKLRDDKYTRYQADDIF